MEWSDWIPAISLNAVILGGLYLARDLITSRIEKGVQHKFDQKIENIRSTLRISEETLKSDLRAKEIEIAALRGGALSGLANRQALLDNRRLEAVERVWSAVVDLAPGKFIASAMAVIKFEESAKEAARNPDFRKLFEIFGQGYDAKNPPTNVAKYEQPFVSPMAWALFSAYQSVVIYAVLQIKTLEHGLEVGPKILKDENVRSVLKAALPHQSNYVDKYGDSGFYYLLEELEQKLINELQKMLEGSEIDAASVERSAQILKEVDKVSADNIARRDSIKIK